MRSALFVSVVALVAMGAACTPATVLSSSPPPPPPSQLVLADAVAAKAPEKASDGEVQAEGGEPASRLESKRTLRTLGWISLGVSAESLLVAIPTSIVLLHKKSVLDSDCNAQKQCTQAGLNVANGLPELTTVNTISWILAVVGAGAGAVLLITTKPDASSGTTVSISPGGVSGRF